MEPKAIKAAITSIENQLEILKASCGLSPDVGEEEPDAGDDEGEADASENKTQPVAERARRRGRHKALAQFEKESD